VGADGGQAYDPSIIASLDQVSTGGTPVTASGQPVGRVLDQSGYNNSAIMPTASARPLYVESGGLKYLESVSGDFLTAAGGGGASSAFFICVAFRCDTLAANQVLIDNRSGNTGFQLYVNSALGRLDGNVWNGTVVVGNATSGGSIVAGTDYVASFWYDGTNTHLQLNSTTAAVSAAVTMAAGPANISVMANLSNTSILDGRLYGLINVRNHLPTEQQREDAKAFLAAKAGVLL